MGGMRSHVTASLEWWASVPRRLAHRNVPLPKYAARGARTLVGCLVQ